MKDKDKKLAELTETLKDLEKLLEDRIVELHETVGGQQSRHAYCYYRSYVWKAQKILRELYQD